MTKSTSSYNILLLKIISRSGDVGLLLKECHRRFDNPFDRRPFRVIAVTAVEMFH